MKRLIAGSLVVAGVPLFAVNSLGDQGSRPRQVVVTAPTFTVPVSTQARPDPPNCPKTFTLKMAKRAARAVYAGTRHVKMSERRMLGRIERCQRNRANVSRVRRFYATERQLWRNRCWNAAHPYHYGVASWYDLSGPGACGTGAQDGYAFASLFLSCGTAIDICGPAGCVTAVMKDHGPYVAGRDFDLNVNLRDAIGCSGVCSVRWRLH